MRRLFILGVIAALFIRCECFSPDLSLDEGEACDTGCSSTFCDNDMKCCYTATSGNQTICSATRSSCLKVGLHKSCEENEDCKKGLGCYFFTCECAATTCSWGEEACISDAEECKYTCCSSDEECASGNCVKRPQKRDVFPLRDRAVLPDSRRPSDGRTKDLLFYRDLPRTRDKSPNYDLSPEDGHIPEG
jgi:hypothetical protein